MNSTEAGRALTEILVHYGVKGMKWGVRRNTSSRVSIGRNRLTGNIKTRGGLNRKPSEDAKRAAISKQIAKKSGYKALSNKQLEDYIRRMDLERRATKIDHQNNIGAQFIRELLKTSAAAAA
jgi:hypothetical protein